MCFTIIKNRKKEIIDFTRNNEIEGSITFLYKNNKKTVNCFVNGYCLTTKSAMSHHNLPEHKEVYIPILPLRNLILLEKKLYINPNQVDLAFSKDWLFMRMGLSLKMLDSCLNYLENRYSGRQKLNALQLTRNDVALFLTEYTTIDIESNMEDIDLTTLQKLHQKLSDAKQYLLGLCGASGFINDGIIEMNYISRLIQDIYGGVTDG
ncbi:hypothetical protein QGM71_18265 [Virgibacillus sp. C22-A2]|uniref:Uncharacterized protein n=1 Tax=Virgibacillus tibetensis TaxID=3042313 RepID=A0ABU6KJC5_9BACI|nr:hypothetical protein [Virgibacillus sp. C22-A2]